MNFCCNSQMSTCQDRSAGSQCATTSCVTLDQLRFELSKSHSSILSGCLFAVTAAMTLISAELGMEGEDCVLGQLLSRPLSAQTCVQHQIATFQVPFCSSHVCNKTCCREGLGECPQDQPFVLCKAWHLSSKSMSIVSTPMTLSLCEMSHRIL